MEEQQLEHLDYVSSLQRKNEQDKLEEECRQEQAIAKLKGEAKLREQVLEVRNYQKMDLPNMEMLIKKEMFQTFLRGNFTLILLCTADVCHR